MSRTNINDLVYNYYEEGFFSGFGKPKTSFASYNGQSLSSSNNNSAVSQSKNKMNLVGAKYDPKLRRHVGGRFV